MRGVVIVAVFVAALFAGCAGKSPEATGPAAEPEAFEDLTVTETKGLIRGIVISETITPIAGAEVKLVSTGQTVASDEQGAFVFNNLEPGDYFLSITKPGYFAVQSSATVVAGVAEPPIVKVQLVFDVANQPFTELLQWTGFFGCGAGTSAGGSVNPCAADAIVCDETDVCVMNSSNTHFFDFGTARVPDLAQAEAVWTGTQPLGNALNLGWFDSGVSDFKSTSGESPLILPTTRDEIVKAHDENITGLLVRIFSGTSQELTVTMQQRFDVYVTYFYGFVPREGWTFAADGNCAGPDQCGA
ncbi:MAG: carboxypeptidase-like regulatory domain-containing protein [Candidatus Thermoplasmatota archaeon]|jgi:hypothetical protein